MADQSNPWIWSHEHNRYYRYDWKNGERISVWQGYEDTSSHSRADSAYSQSSQAYSTAGTSSSPTQYNVESQAPDATPKPNAATLSDRQHVDEGAYDGSTVVDDYAGYGSHAQYLSAHQPLDSYQKGYTQSGAVQGGVYQYSHQVETPQTYKAGPSPYAHIQYGNQSSANHGAQYSNNQNSFTSQNNVQIYGIPSQEGPTLRGTWGGGGGGGGGGGNYYEELDPSYYVRTRDFFTPGRMIAVLFTEAAGSTTTTGYNPCISEVKYGGKVYTQIRRFIVVRQKHEFCYACPVFTYQGRGTLKYGVRPHEHAVVHTLGYPPVLLPGETGITKDPIAVKTPGSIKLDDASRIYFGIHHPIQYNVKVKDLGMVIPSDIPKVIGYWREEQQ